MAKLRKHFEFSTPVHKIGKQPYFIDITICGIGYKDEDSTSFDIEELWYCDSNTKKITQIPVSVVEAIYGVDSINEIDHIYNACAAHMSYLFSPAYDKEKAAQDFDNTSKTVAA